MPAYIIETGRSYENPVDSEDYTRTYTSDDHPSFGSGYTIEFEDAGPGSYNFGRDEVFYIGNPTEFCVANCDVDRRGVWRYYNGADDDHLYWVDETIPNNRFFDRRGYNHEPRNKAPSFQLLRENVSGTQPVYLKYSSGNKNSYLDSSSSGEVRKLGYIFTSSGGAAAAGALNSGEISLPLYHYRKNNSDGYDDFYTTNPAQEVNLSGGPIAPKDPLNGEYVYQGIYGYVLDGAAPRAQKRYQTAGSAYNTGEVDRAGWYQYNNTWSRRRYEDEPEATPAQEGWGDPNNADLADEDANFEWFYGKNGAVKASVPRFLGFHDAFEGQFLYYLYDTSFPFNGPIYGINFTTTDAQCCPQRSQSECVPNVEYHSYYYEMREDAWVTKKTTLTVDAPDDGGAESFWTVGTDDHMLFFRYTSSSGAFRIGETLNGWQITQARYFGDELKCGYMRFRPVTGRTGNAFTYLQSISSQDGATATVLAGYGIADKGAFFGVYEFPKKVSYYKVEIDDAALIPRRTFDEAILEAVVNKKGQIKEVKIINAGKDYRNPSLQFALPDIIREEGFADAAENIPEVFEDDISGEYAISLETNQEFDTTDKSIRKIARQTRKQQWTSEDNFTGTFKRAEGYVVINELGCVKQVVITDPGNGYQPGEDVRIFVTDRETERTEQTVIGEAAPNIKNATQLSQDIQDPNVRSAFKEFEDVLGSTMDSVTKPIQHDYITSYIRSTDINNKEKMKFCSDTLPMGCVKASVGSDWHDINTFVDIGSLWSQTANANPRWNANTDFLTETKKNSERNSIFIDDKYTSGMEGFYGGCPESQVQNLYGVRRFFDIPCPYQEYGTDGKLKTIGYLPFKYCGSDKEHAVVKISLSVEGDVSGAGQSVNRKFFEWLEELEKPTLTPGRPVSGGYKSHPCTRGTNVKGRCYETSNGQYTFVPTSGDENTFDFNGNGATGSTSNVELNQLKTWIGDNVSSYVGLFFNQVIVDGNDVELYQNNVPYTNLVLDTCSNDKFPNLCWHNFVADGVLNVYSGYDSNGNGIASDDICDGYPFRSCGFGNWALRNVIHSTVAFDTGKIAENDLSIELGPYNGNMTWINYKTGAVRTLNRVLELYGNPYFDECDLQ